jgi:hypothetical protein
LRGHGFGPYRRGEGCQYPYPGNAGWTRYYDRRRRLKGCVIQRFLVAVGMLASEQVLALTCSSQASSLSRLFGGVLVRVQR